MSRTCVKMQGFYSRITLLSIKGQGFSKKSSLGSHPGRYTCNGKMVFLASIHVFDAVRESRVSKTHLLMLHVLRVSV